MDFNFVSRERAVSLLYSLPDDKVQKLIELMEEWKPPSNSARGIAKQYADPSKIPFEGEAAWAEAAVEKERRIMSQYYRDREYEQRNAS